MFLFSLPPKVPCPKDHSAFPGTDKVLLLPKKSNTQGACPGRT